MNIPKDIQTAPYWVVRAYIAGLKASGSEDEARKRLQSVWDQTTLRYAGDQETK